jgi:hypothetical protein
MVLSFYPCERVVHHNFSQIGIYKGYFYRQRRTCNEVSTFTVDKQALKLFVSAKFSQTGIADFDDIDYMV